MPGNFFPINVPPEVEAVRAVVDLLEETVGPVGAAVALGVLDHPLDGPAGDFDARN